MNMVIELLVLYRKLIFTQTFVTLFYSSLFMSIYFSIVKSVISLTRDSWVYTGYTGVSRQVSFEILFFF